MKNLVLAATLLIAGPVIFSQSARTSFGDPAGGTSLAVESGVVSLPEGTGAPAMGNPNLVANAGIVCDGKTDNSPRWQALKNAAKESGGGTIHLPFGVCVFSSGITFSAGDDGLVLEGEGDHYPPSTVRGTVLRSTSSSADTITVSGASMPLQRITIRDLMIKGGGGGACIDVDARQHSVYEINIDRVSGTGCGDGLYLQGGVGSGGFLFDVRMSDDWFDGNGGIGVHGYGSVTNVHSQKLWLAGNKGGALKLDGVNKGLLTAGWYFDNATLSGPTAPNTYCVVLHDAQDLDFRDSHFETCTYGNVLLQSVRGATFKGGYFSQTGNAYGFTIDTGDYYINDGIEIDIPNWNNTSSHALFHVVNHAYFENSILGRWAGHVIEPSNFDGPFNVSQGDVQPIFLGRLVDGTFAASAGGATGKQSVPWVTFIPASLNGNTSYNDLRLDRAITVNRIQANIQNPGHCSSGPTICVTSGGDCSTGGKLSLSAAYHLDSGPLNINFPAGSTIYVRTAVGTCASPPQVANVTVQYSPQ